MIAQHLPGAGITPLNVHELTLDWWLVYVHRVQRIIEARQKK